MSTQLINAEDPVPVTGKRHSPNHEERFPRTQVHAKSPAPLMSDVLKTISRVTAKEWGIER